MHPLLISSETIDRNGEYKLVANLPISVLYCDQTSLCAADSDLQLFQLDLLTIHIPLPLMITHEPVAGSVHSEEEV